jgi:hypothetical protein
MEVIPLLGFEILFHRTLESVKARIAILYVNRMRWRRLSIAGALPDFIGTQLRAQAGQPPPWCSAMSWCSVCPWSQCAARSQASQQPSAEFSWRNRGTLALGRDVTSSPREGHVCTLRWTYLSTARCILPLPARELGADRPTVLPLYVQSRLGVIGVVSQQAGTQQRAASFAAEVGLRGRAPPPHIRLDHASSIPWCRQSLAGGTTGCPVGGRVGRADAR